MSEGRGILDSDVRTYKLYIFDYFPDNFVMITQLSNKFIQFSIITKIKEFVLNDEIIQINDAFIK